MRFAWLLQDINGTMQAIQNRLIQSACEGHAIGKQDMLNHLEYLKMSIMKMPEEKPLDDQQSDDV